jgi:hypothetical protein
MHGSASPNAEAITLAQLQEGLTRTDPASGPPPFGYGGTMYWLGWPQKFDYLLITHFGAATESLPPVLRRVAHTDVADLYQIAGHEPNDDARIRR